MCVEREIQLRQNKEEKDQWLTSLLGGIGGQLIIIDQFVIISFCCCYYDNFILCFPLSDGW